MYQFVVDNGGWDNYKWISRIQTTELRRQLANSVKSSILSKYSCCYHQLPFEARSNVPEPERLKILL